MKQKHFILALVAMLWSFSVSAQTTVVMTETELRDALAAGGEVTLDKSIEVTEMIVVPAGVTATLDLNGQAITVPEADADGKHIYVIDNQGILTLKDGIGGGSITARGIYNGYNGNAENAKLTIESGKYIGMDNGGAAIFNGAELVINGGEIHGYRCAVDNALETANTTINGGTFGGFYKEIMSTTYIIRNDKGNLVINDADVISGFGAVGCYGGTTVINDGSFLPTGWVGSTCHVVYVAKEATVTINGGTFKMNYPADAVPDSGLAVASYYGGTLTISGGSFTAHFDNVSPVELSAGSEITGGSYYNHAGEASTHSYVTKYIKEGYKLGEDGSINATFVAKIGSETYDTFDEALTAASAMSGDITVELYDKVTLNSSLSGSYSSIKFVGKDTDAEIYLDVQGYITATGKKVAFEDLTLSKSEGGYITNAGFMNVAFGIYDVTEVTYTNCKFANGAYASSGTVTFNGCTFYRSYDKYGLWAYGDVETTVEGCTFADYRGIKMYAEGAAKTVDLTVKDTDFSAVTDKPAIVLTYGESVTLEGNTYSSKGTFELDLDGAPNGTLVTSDVDPVCVNDNGACGVLVDGKVYTTVAQAAEVAVEGSNVTLLHSTTDEVEFAEGVNLTLADGVTAENVTVAVSAVAQIGTTTYKTLEEAFAAAVEGETITLLADATPALTSQRAITKAAVIDLGGYTMTLTEDDLYFGTTTFMNGTIVVDPSVKPSTAVFWMFANQTLTFDNVKIVATGVTGTYLIGLDGDNSDLNLLNGSEILVENTTALDLDIICVNASTGNDIKVENSKVNVTNLDGRVFFRGNYIVKDSEVNLTGITKAGFRIEAGQTLSIEGASTVTVTGEPRDGGIHLTDATATYTKAETATVNATLNRPSVAQIGDDKFATLADAVAAAQAGDEIVLLADAIENVTLPAGVKFNGNGKSVGEIIAGGELTFTGAVKATSFNVEYTNTTVNIPAGASLEITGSGRMVIGHGCTFNITGSIENAKEADVTTLTPSLVMPGASFTGAGVVFNVTNAYIKTTASYCSSSKSASGTFDFNIDNSIWEQFGKLAFESQSTAATVNFDLVNSVLTTTSHLVFGVSRGEIVIDNSNVNVGTSRQIENQSTMTIKNGSVVNGAVATSSNAKNPGTIIVENATYAVSGEFSGSDLGTGTIILKRGANVSAGTITKADITVDAEGMTAGDAINLTANLSKFAGTLSVVNNDNLNAQIVDGKVVLVAKPVAKIGDVEYTSLEDAFKAATADCTIDILSDVTVDYAWDARKTGAKFTVPVTINGNDNTIKFTASVDDKNYQAPFRFEADATVKNLTIDMSEATDSRFRAISSKGNLTVDGCKFIGKDETLNCRAIIFGEGAGANVGNLTISITNSEFINWKRGITDNENGQDVKTVTITGNTLEDAAVYVSASESIVFNNNTVNGETDLRSYAADNVLSVQAQDNILSADKKNYIYAKTIDAQEEFETETPPLKVATKAELNAALAAAEEGDVIILTADIDYGTDQLKIDKPITLNLGGNTLTTGNAYGGMSIKNNPTIKNGTIVHKSNTAAIKVWNATAFEDLVIDVQGKGDANKTIGGIVLQSGSTTKVGSIKNVTIKGAALTNGIETYNCGDATENVIGAMENVTIDAQGTGMLISAPCGTATNCSIKGGVNGIELWIKGNYSASLDLVASTVEGGVYAHDEFSSNPSIVNNGTIKFTADDATTGADAEDVTLEIARVEADNVQGVLKEVMDNAQAKLGNVYYATIDAAIKAAQVGETVTILAGTYAMPSVKAGITIEGEVDSEGNSLVLLEGTLSGTLENLTLKNLHIKGGHAQRWAYAKGDLLFENVTFEATSVYALHFDGITEGTNLTYKDCTIIGWAAMGGSPASCVFDGCTIKDNGTYGVIRTYFDATITDCTFDVANANTEDVYQDGIHAVEGAEVTVNNCTNANGDMKDLVNVSGTSVVTVDGVEIKNVAAVNDKNFTSLQAALDAAQAGETVTLLSDMAIESDLNNAAKGLFNIDADAQVTIDLNGKTIDVTDKSAGNFIVFYNYGDLTIKNGTVNLVAENNRGWSAQSTIILNRGGNLTVESGTYTHQGGTDMAIALDNSGNSFGDACMTIVDGTVESTTYTAIRNRMADPALNGDPGNGTVELNVEGGHIKGVKRGIWGQITNASSEFLGSLTVTGGTIEGTTDAAIKMDGDSYENITVAISDAAVIKGDLAGDAVDYNVTGGTFYNEIAEDYLALGYQLEGDAAPYTVEYTGKVSELTLVDGEFTEYTYTTGIKVGTFTYKRTFPAEWAPIYVPFEIPVAELVEQGFEVAYINGVRRDDTDYDGELDKFVMEIIYIHGGNADGSGKTLKANYPYFIKATSGVTELNLTLNDVTLYKSEDKSYDCTTMTERFELTGNNRQMSYTEFGNNMYVVGKDKDSGKTAWGNLKSGSLKPFRFYMTVTGRDNAQPVDDIEFMSISIRGEEREDGTTYIYDLEVEEEKSVDYIYDLQGRRVTEPQKGNLYIINGKKVIF